MSVCDEADQSLFSRFYLGRLLDAAEVVAPVEAVDAVAVALNETGAAERESFLIADFSGDSLIRLGSSLSGRGYVPGGA